MATAAAIQEIGRGVMNALDAGGRGASGACASAASASRSPPRRRTSHGAKALATVTVAAVTAAATSPSASAADARKMPTEARAGGVTTINRSGLGTFAYTAPAHAPCKRGRRKPRRSSSSGGGDDGGDGNWGNGGDGGNNNWGDGNGENEFSNASVFFDALSLLALSGSLSHVVAQALSGTNQSQTSVQFASCSLANGPRPVAVSA